MFASLVLALVSLYQPASFELALDGNRDATITLNGQRLVPGRVYCTAERFIGTVDVEIEVRWVDGDTLRRQTLTIPLRSGRHLHIEINVPGRPAVVWV